ncbi:nuclear transport factor 2 family protein [Lentzea sp. NPDC003310]|uniref:nuclear transport factor 2 family protein n=1 Tax=Lentzea sp. NPDC003310 TaxID=3154447 RepID=UPI0033AC6048
MSTTSDRAEIIELIGNYATISDRREFTTLPARTFTDEVTVDFSSVAGMPEMTVPLSAYVESLSGAFSAFKATHHAITGHVVEIDGDTASVRAHVRAEHWYPDEAGVPRWLVVGFYDNEAVRTPAGWRLSRVKLTAVHQENAPRPAGLLAGE